MSSLSLQPPIRAMAACALDAAQTCFVLPERSLTYAPTISVSARRTTRVLPKKHEVCCGLSARRMSVMSVSVPESAEESVSQALSACVSAFSEGHQLLTLQLLLPLIGATELDDWPGGIRQQYIAAKPLVESLLRQLSSHPSLAATSDSATSSGPSEPRVLDDADVVVLFNSDVTNLILFPTADTIATVLRARDEKAGKRLILVNPQWQDGQVISDFGFGDRRKKAEEFLSRFIPAYSLKQLRVQSQDVRILRCYPGGWQVYTVDDAGSSSLVLEQDSPPSYKELQAVLGGAGDSTGSSKGQGQGLWGRLVSEFAFNKKSM